MCYPDFLVEGEEVAGDLRGVGDLAEDLHGLVEEVDRVRPAIVHDGQTEVVSVAQVQVDLHNVQHDLLGFELILVLVLHTEVLLFRTNLKN